MNGDDDLLLEQPKDCVIMFSDIVTELVKSVVGLNVFLKYVMFDMSKRGIND